MVVVGTDASTATLHLPAENRPVEEQGRHSADHKAITQNQFQDDGKRARHIGKQKSDDRPDDAQASGQDIAAHWRPKRRVLPDGGHSSSA